MLAKRIYEILNKYRKNPDNLTYDSAVISHKIENFINENSPIVMVFPACHGKISNPNLVIDHMPDLSEYLAIELFSNMCEEIKAIYPPGVKLFMVHEGHFYVGTLLMKSDKDMDEYIAKLREMLLPYPYIKSLTLQDFFPSGYTNPQCRAEFFSKYAPTLEETRELVAKSDTHKHLYEKYLARILANFQEQYEDSQDKKFKNYNEFGEFNALQQLRLWIGFRNLLKEFFAGVDYIRLSSVYKDPSVKDQIALNYIPANHLEMPSFNCVAQFKDGGYGFITKKDAVKRNFILSEDNGFKFYKEK